MSSSSTKNQSGSYSNDQKRPTKPSSGGDGATSASGGDRRYKSFHDFYPFYLSQHSKPITRYFHFVGTSLSMIVAITGGMKNIWMVPIVGYGFAWISHAFIEKNKPATFEYPIYSFRGDFLMWSEMIRGRRWTNK